MWIMVAITPDMPDWNAKYVESSKQTNEPKNLVKEGATYTRVYILLVTRSCRHWQNGNAAGVIFDSHNPPHPYLKQVFEMEVNKST